MNEPTSQDVFALRKEGRLDEAISIARKVHTTDPLDEWSIKAIFWVLYDLIKRSAAESRPDLTSLVHEFSNLDLSNFRDKYIEKAEAYVLRLSLPGGNELFKARELSKSGKHFESLKILRRLNQQYPGREDIEETLGWEIYRGAKNTEDGSDAIWSYLGEYSKLTTVHEPSQLHSYILMVSLRTAKSSGRLLDFVRWWNLDNLRAEDWDKYEGRMLLDDFGVIPDSKPGKDFTPTSLALRLSRALYQNIKNFHVDEVQNFGWVTDFLVKVNDKDADEYIPYYLIKLMTWAGLDTSEVRTKIIPLVRKKHNDYWIWESLAETYDKVNECYALCLCKAAISIAQEDSYKRDIYTKLTEYLTKKQQIKFASVAAEISIKLYREAGQTPPDSVVQLSNIESHDSNNTANFNKFLYRCASEAEMILLEDLEPSLAVISQINTEKGLAVAAFTVRQIGLLHYDRWPDAKALQVGDIISARADRNDNKAIILAWEKSNEVEISGLYKYFEGRIEIHHGNSFGFVHSSIGDIFVPPSLIKEQGIEDQYQLSGYAVNEWNKKKRLPGWRVLMIDNK